MNLDYLKEYDYVVVMGHRNPDMDSIVSSILVRDILRSFGVKSDFAVIKNSNSFDSNIKNMNDLIDEKPLEISAEEIGEYKFFLVDHNDVNQSIKKSNLVVGCIDHHLSSGKIDYYYKDLGACALVIYDLFKDKYDFSQKHKKLIYFAFLSDTNFGKSSRYSISDERLVKELGYNTNYDNHFKKYFKETKISENNFKESGFKVIDINGIEFESSFLNVVNKEDKKEKYINFVKESNCNYIGLWYDFGQECTFTYVKLAGELLVLKYDFIASRAMDIVPDVQKIIKDRKMIT